MHSYITYGRREIVEFKLKKKEAKQILEHIKTVVRYKLVGPRMVAADFVNVSLFNSWGLFALIFD